ncbi:MAG: fructose-bisphosphate aldolase, partial [Halobacteriota archaeon]
MTGKKLRLERIRDRESGNFLVVPMDHGVTIGPARGLENIDTTIRDIADGGGDSVLVHKGVAERGYLEADRDIGLVVHVNGATEIGP